MKIDSIIRQLVSVIEALRNRVQIAGPWRQFILDISIIVKVH